MENNELKYRLRMPFLKGKGLNKEELKRCTGANDLAVTKWAAGVVLPSLETLLTLAVITNTNISYLLMLTDVDTSVSSQEIHFRLKETRVLQNITQKDLAEKAGVTAKCISNYEISEELVYSRKGLRVLISVAEALSVYLDYLLGLTDQTIWEDIEQCDNVMTLNIEESPFYKVKPGAKIHIRNDYYDQMCRISEDGCEIILEDGERIHFRDPRLLSTVITIS